MNEKVVKFNIESAIHFCSKKFDDGTGQNILYYLPVNNIKYILCYGNVNHATKISNNGFD